MVSLTFAKDYRLRLLGPIRFERAHICRVLLIFVTAFHNRGRDGILLSTHVNLQTTFALLLAALLLPLVLVALFLKLVLLSALLLIISCLFLAFL